jgi:hypothetical protein
MTIEFPFAIGDKVTVPEFGITGAVYGVGQFQNDAEASISVRWSANGKVESRWFFAHEVKAAE